MIDATGAERRTETPDPEAADSEATVPWLGGLVAAVMCMVFAFAGWLIAPPTGWIIGVVGIPGTTFLAWRMAPRVIHASGTRVLAIAGGLAIGSIFIADSIVSIVVATASIVSETGHVLADGGEVTLPGFITAGVVAFAFSIFLFIVGAVVVGVFALVSVVPAALIWAVTVRRLAERSWAR